MDTSLLQNIEAYKVAFQNATSHTPRPYQLRVAAALDQRRHVLLRAPTGSGKTLAVVMPFLLGHRGIGVRRLIYTLPLRTLVHSLHAEAAKYAAAFGKTATVQTGAQPDDPFFDKGDLIFTTYDQLLSGYLCGPYGLSSRLHNINAAAVAGNLIVFDEFHLMDTARAFLTAAHCIGTFRSATLSVWMTATATSPVCEFVKSELDADEIRLSESESHGLHSGSNIRRTIQKVARQMNASDILAHPGKRVLAVVNRVSRAQQLYREITAGRREAILLHARFFASDRDKQRLRIQELFSVDANQPAVAIATQVVEAGLDISADILLTESCPMNALVQRAGRCARFPGQQGEVIVFKVGSARPYTADELQRAWDVIEDGVDLAPTTAASWVERAHRDADEHQIEESRGSMKTRSETIIAGVQRMRDGGVSHLIRENSDTVSVLLSRNPTDVFPRQREMISIWRTQLARLKTGWTYDPDEPSLWRSISRHDEMGFIVAIHPRHARYTREEGLVLFEVGQMESPLRPDKAEKNEYRYKAEFWRDHIDRVIARIKQLVEDEALTTGLLALTFKDLEQWCVLAAEHHDLGKLQATWDRWAQSYQQRRDPAYVHVAPLAHTDFDPTNHEDREAMRSCGKRPLHSGASAFHAAALLHQAGVSRDDQIPVLAAIVSHHGGWFQRAQRIDALIDPCKANAPKSYELQKFADKLDMLWENFEDYWPVTALLTRLLRRADQKATQEFQTE